MPNSPLMPAALRGLLDMAPGGVGCFDPAARVVYANTAFTMTTGLQTGQRVEEEPLASELSALRHAPRRVRFAQPHRMPVSGTLFRLDRARVGLVLDAGAHEALAALAEEQSALRRVATFVASDPEPEALFTVVAEEAGRLLHARSAATIRYEDEHALTVGRWVDDNLGGFGVGTRPPLANSDGLTAVVARTGAPARIDDYRLVKGQAAGMMGQRGYRSAGGAAGGPPPGGVWGAGPGRPP